MRPVQVKSILLCGASVAMTLAASAAFAQAPADAGGGIEEIVVTAQKRAENLQKVAASVQAVTADTLSRQGVKELADITKTVPDVTVVGSNGGAIQNIAIRGVRTGAFGPTTDSPNAVHIDGVYVSRFTATQALFFDVERVEVLTGPQGTLYGRNATGGTINVITRRPGKEYSGNITAELGNYDAVNINAGLTVPLTDTLSTRFAYFRNSHDGYNTDNGTDDADQQSARFSAQWTPTDKDTLLFTADAEKIGGKGPGPAVITEVLKNPTILTNAATGAVSLVPAGTAGGVVVPFRLQDDIRHTGQTYGDFDRQQGKTKSGGVMGQYDHDFGWANLTVQGAYRTTNTHNTQGTSSGFPQDPRLVAGAVLRPAAYGFLDANSRWNSQEIRLTSPSSNVFTWVAGLYRFHEHSYDNHSGSYRVSYPNTTGTVGQVAYPTPFVINSDVANPLLDNDAYAAFGQGTYSPSALDNRLHLTAGIRFNHEEKTGSGYIINNATVNPLTVFNNVTAKFKKTTYKLNASYDITSRSLVYIDHSTGFKSGGFAYGPTPVYNPENIKSYEIGTKNRFFDNRLQVNAAAWIYNYNDFVTTVPFFYLDNLTGRPANTINTINAADSKIKGQSISVDWAATDHDLLNLNFVHTDAKYKSFNIAGNYALAFANNLLPGATPAFFDYSNTRIGNVPKYAFNGFYEHTFDVLGGELSAQIATHYVGTRLSANQASPVTPYGYIILKSYHTEDVSLRYQPAEGMWSVTGYVRNLANKDVELAKGYSASNANVLASDPSVTFAYRTTTYGAPRTFGVILSARF